MSASTIAEVIIDIKHSDLDKPFDYRVPSEWLSSVKRGMRVHVPFGNSYIAGIITDLKSHSAHTALKPIHALPDDEAYFDEERLTMAQTLAFTHVRPRMAYLNAMLPGALASSAHITYRLKDSRGIDSGVHAYFKNTSTIDKRHIAPKDRKKFKTAETQGHLSTEVAIRQSANIRTVKTVMLIKDITPKGSKQRAIVDYLKTHGATDKPTLLKATGAASASLRSLETQDIVVSVSRERYREITHAYAQRDKDVTLTHEQQRIVDAIVAHAQTTKEHLIHGVTSSGKTELYIAMARCVIARGEKVIVLVPEIALTPQLLARFKAVFQGRTGVYHSALSPGEQYDEWRRALRGEVDIMIGTRSAIFAPFASVGLIIIDEEQSDAYIQREQAEYDAREVARMRRAHHRGLLVYGSATPSVETYHASVQGTITRHTLSQRALGSFAPVIRRVDMKKEFKSGNPSILSSALHTAIHTRLQNNEQTLLMINRRGHANFVLCRDCGKRIKCPHCEVSLTYHKHTDHLKCHYCNHSEPAPARCPSCNSRHIRYMGLGSEKAQTVLQQTFPEANVMRMDKDTTTNKGAHERLLQSFETHGDILVGTQMIAKGLDFPRVTLVGVLSADMALFIPDFYAESETYSLLSQLAGRAGRRDTRGEMIIQAYDASHSILEAIEAQDYDAFYRREITFRKQANVEPYASLTLIVIAHESYDKAYTTALEIKRKLSGGALDALGPADAKMVKRGGFYRVQLLVRHQKEPSVYPLLNDTLSTFNHSGARISLTHHPRIF